MNNETMEWMCTSRIELSRVIARVRVCVSFDLWKPSKTAMVLCTTGVLSMETVFFDFFIGFSASIDFNSDTYANRTVKNRQITPKAPAKSTEIQMSFETLEWKCTTYTSDRMDQYDGLINRDKQYQLTESSVSLFVP